MTAPVLPLLLDTYDYVADRLRTRLGGLTDEEYLWRPVPDMWSVHEQDGRWVPDPNRDVPPPAPMTTIAWRTWHIASDCLAGYITPHLGDWPLPVPEGQWYGDAASALTDLDRAVSEFRTRISALGEEGLARELGPQWGPYEHDSWAALVLHAIDEVVHHGAEIALLRDLYLRRDSLSPAAGAQPR
jgi:hypothetical protein